MAFGTTIHECIMLSNKPGRGKFVKRCLLAYYVCWISMIGTNDQCHYYLCRCLSPALKCNLLISILNHCNPKTKRVLANQRYRRPGLSVAIQRKENWHCSLPFMCNYVHYSGFVIRAYAFMLCIYNEEKAFVLFETGHHRIITLLDLSLIMNRS